MRRPSWSSSPSGTGGGGRTAAQGCAHQLQRPAEANLVSFAPWLIWRRCLLQCTFVGAAGVAACVMYGVAVALTVPEDAARPMPVVLVWGRLREQGCASGRDLVREHGDPAHRVLYLGGGGLARQVGCGWCLLVSQPFVVCWLSRAALQPAPAALRCVFASPARPQFCRGGLGRHAERWCGVAVGLSLRGGEGVLVPPGSEAPQSPPPIALGPGHAALPALPEPVLYIVVSTGPVLGDAPLQPATVVAPRRLPWPRAPQACRTRATCLCGGGTWRKPCATTAGLCRMSERRLQWACIPPRGQLGLWSCVRVMPVALHLPAVEELQLQAQA